MFTGIIEEVGTLSAVTWGHRSCALRIRCGKVLEDARLGDSIAVNGICLTVTAKGKDWFTADATPETMKRTALSEMKTGDPVNLERPLPVGGRLGGHIVAGHVDATGRLETMTRDENAVNLTISFAPDKMKYILEKGSVAVDGVSLTVTKRDGRSFSVSLIPHTGQETTLLQKKPGALVNIECDCIGKYVEQLMGEKASSGVTMDLLRRTLG